MTIIDTERQALLGQLSYGGYTRKLRTASFDDLHEDEQQFLVRWAADNLPMLHEDDEDGRLSRYSDMNLIERRQAVRQFDTVTAPRVKEACRTVNHTPWFLMWLPRPRRAVADLLVFAETTLQKIEGEECTGLEQFGPIKRAVNYEFRA